MKWINVNYKRFEEFVKEHNLKETGNFLTSEWMNEKGEVLAKRQYGFAFEMYSIFTTENEETVALVGSIIDKYAR